MRWDREKERKAAKNYNIGMNVFAVIFSIFWCDFNIKFFF